MADTTRDISAGAEPVTARLEAVDQQMVRIIQSLNSTPARDAALYHLKTGGHRMRARLALASTADWDRHDDAVLAAAACELLHNASLIHDDISDGDGYRRGHPTVRALHGDDVALCAGDLMMAASFDAASRLSDSRHASELTRSMAHCAARVIGGQSTELARGNGAVLPDFREYLDTTRSKTAPLIEVAIGAGQTASPRTVRSVSEGIGLAYQILDDLDDLTGFDNPMAEQTRLHAYHAWRHHQLRGPQAAAADPRRVQARCLRHVQGALGRADHLADEFSSPLRDGVRELIRRLHYKAQRIQQSSHSSNGE